MLIEQTLVCPVIVGRGTPMAALRRVLDRAREGHGASVLVWGDAGIGKSRLLRAATEDARHAGFLVLQGACFEADRSLPFAPLLDLVRTLVGASSPAAAAHALGPAVPVLLALFPELRGTFADAQPIALIDPEGDRRRLFHAVAEALHTLARTQPVLLVVEDAHWSDDASLELVLHLARTLAQHAVVLALSYRGDETGPALTRVLAELDRTRTVLELPLAHLDRAEVHAMLRAIFGPAAGLGEEFAGMLHGLTEGNPFFVEEVLKALVIAGDLAPTAEGRWRIRPLDRVRVPRTAVDAVRRRLSGLSAAARELIAVAAVAGRGFDFALLQAVTHRRERELLALLKELLAAQLVAEESADRFAFRHALTREAIRAELLARERLARHREIAAAIERVHAATLDAHVGELAYHTFEAGEWDRARAFAERAAHQALSVHAPREALAHLDRAFAASERAGAVPPLSLSMARGRALETLGDFQGADVAFAAALGRARAAHRADAEWEALHALGMLWAARDYARAGAYRRDALAVARGLDDPLLVARSLNRVGNWHINLEQAADARRHHEEALEQFERAGDRRGVAETVDLLAMSAFIAGDMGQAAAFCDRAIALFGELNDRRGLSTALALRAHSAPSIKSSYVACAPAGDDVEALLQAARPARLAREIGWRAGEAFALFVLAECHGWRGAYDRALPMAREGYAIAEEIDHPQWQCFGAYVLGAFALDLFAHAAALAHLERAYAIARQLGSRTWTRWTAAQLAVALAHTGDADRARAMLDDAAPPASLGLGAPPSRGEAAPTLGERQVAVARAAVALASGDAELACALVEQRIAAERRAAGDSAIPLPRLTLIHGQALAALGHDAAARATLRAAVDEATAGAAAPVAWRAHAALGALHRARRRRAEARAAFVAARGIVAELAARVPDEALRASLRGGAEALVPPERPPTARAAAKAAYAGLTRREREVAQFVAHGRANRAIADALGIGERTVEGHVANALAKLGFSSRAQLAAWAVEQGLARAPSAAARR